jgi:membrane associated rhomboid family serine protease
MGVYDRDYYRAEEPTGLFAGRPVVINLIIINAAVYLLDLLTDHKLITWLWLPSDLYREPWEIWRLITCGFVHDPKDITHILFNMFGLFVFGREMEDHYGRGEFLRFYLSAIVVGALFWLLTVQTPLGGRGVLLGASGGVVAVVVLNILNYPQRDVLLFGIVPMKAWVFGVLFVLGDVYGAFNRTTPVAHSVHLAGAAFAAAYFYGKWNLSFLVPATLVKKLTGPKLRVHSPEDEDPRELNARVDEILDKISRQGEASLTRKERSTLEQASKRYQRRNKP